MSLPALRYGLFALALILLGAGVWLLVADAPPVVVSWETGSEVGTAGFNVYRAPAWEPQAPTKVNTALIPAAGDEMVGSAYRFKDRDRALVPGRRYRYQIEEVEWDGSTTLYPEAVVVRAGLPTTWTKIEGAGLVLLALVLASGAMRQQTIERQQTVERQRTADQHIPTQKSSDDPGTPR